jgi:hypothetical protein
MQSGQDGRATTKKHKDVQTNISDQSNASSFPPFRVHNHTFIRTLAQQALSMDDRPYYSSAAYTPSRNPRMDTDALEITLGAAERHVSPAVKLKTPSRTHRHPEQDSRGPPDNI